MRQLVSPRRTPEKRSVAPMPTIPRALTSRSAGAATDTSEQERLGHHFGRIRVSPETPPTSTSAVEPPRTRAPTPASASAQPIQPEWYKPWTWFSGWGSAGGEQEEREPVETPRQQQTGEMVGGDTSETGSSAQEQQAESTSKKRRRNKKRKKKKTSSSVSEQTAQPESSKPEPSIQNNSPEKAEVPSGSDSSHQEVWLPAKSKARKQRVRRTPQEHYDAKVAERAEAVRQHIDNALTGKGHSHGTIVPTESVDRSVWERLQKSSRDFHQDVLAEVQKTYPQSAPGDKPYRNWVWKGKRGHKQLGNLTFKERQSRDIKATHNIHFI